MQLQLFTRSNIYRDTLDMSHLKTKDSVRPQAKLKERFSLTMEFIQLFLSNIRIKMSPQDCIAQISFHKLIKIKLYSETWADLRKIGFVAQTTRLEINKSQVTQDISRDSSVKICSLNRTEIQLQKPLVKNIQSVITWSQKKDLSPKILTNIDRRTSDVLVSKLYS